MSRLILARRTGGQGARPWTATAGATVLALVMTSCGGDATSPTLETTAPPSAGPASSDDSVSSAAQDCEQLAEAEIEAVAEISAELETSGSAAGESGLPEFCRVALTVEPAIKIEVWLPTDQYNHRFQAVGNGGYAGEITYGALAEALRAGYATAATDTGHAGHELDGSFALTAAGSLDFALIEDFATRSLIELTNVSRSLIEAFYGEPADYAYWNGCSTGGRQGMLLAQRHPEAYDGILAAAPAINWDRFLPSLLWAQVVMQEELGRPIEGCKLAAVTAAAVEACDAADGVSDGVIGDPGACQVDPASVIGIDTPCGEVTEADAAVIQAIWDGPRSPDGEFLWYGLAPGAPLDAVAGSDPFPIGLDHVATWVQQDPTFDWRSLGYAGFEDVYRTSQELFHDVLGTDDPDLGSFRDAGGKLLMWHGWDDELIPPQGSIDYYERVVQTMGDTGDVADFARLFMAPGVRHCGDGPGATDFDAFGALVDWVESGDPPDKILASPAGAGAAAATRILCPYFLVPTYDGTGDPEEAASFTCNG